MAVPFSRCCLRRCVCGDASKYLWNHRIVGCCMTIESKVLVGTMLVYLRKMEVLFVHRRIHVFLDSLTVALHSGCVGLVASRRNCIW